MLVATPIVDQLVKIYYEQEWWHNKKLPYEEAVKYHDGLLRKGRILYYVEDEEVVGYVESWRLNYEQWGRLVCHEPFSALLEEVNTGPLCYVANVWVRKDRRRSKVIKLLTTSFFKQNYGAKHFVGEALRHKTGLIKVLSKRDAYRRYVGGNDGK